MAQIAADVGLSEAGLVHHFPTKRHLLVGVVERRFAQAAAQALDVPDAADGLRPLRVLLRVTENFLTQPGLIELFVLVSAEAANSASPARAVYAEHYRRVVETIAEELEQGVRSGALQGDFDCVAVAQQCIAMSDGLQLQWVLSGGEFDLVGRIRDYLELLATDISLLNARLDQNAQTVPAS